MTDTERRFIATACFAVAAVAMWIVALRGNVGVVAYVAAGGFTLLALLWLVRPQYMLRSRRQ